MPRKKIRGRLVIKLHPFSGRGAVRVDTRVAIGFVVGLRNFREGGWYDIFELCR